MCLTKQNRSSYSTFSYALIENSEIMGIDVLVMNIEEVYGGILDPFSLQSTVLYLQFDTFSTTILNEDMSYAAEHILHVLGGNIFIADAV